MEPKLNNILSVKNFGHDNRSHCYIRDWQGNIRNDRDYYPYGLPTSVSSIPESDSYGFSGKEFEQFRGLNLYDFEARTYVPDEARFWQPDPMADDYPGISPYAYCAGDPINFIDPTGEKVYYVDMTGRLVTPSEAMKDFNQAEYEKGLEGLDRIVIIGIDGQIIEESQTYPEGTITQMEDATDADGNKVTTFQINGHLAANELFETAALSYVEWGLLVTDNKITKDKNQCFLTTAHAEGSNSGINHVVNKILSPATHSVSFIYHNHPSDTPYPSGLGSFNNKPYGDIGFAKSFWEKYQQSPYYFIYLPRSERYINYDQHSHKIDFQ